MDMKKNSRVLITGLGPTRGMTGTYLGMRRGLLLPKMRLSHIVRLDNGEIVYVGSIQRLKTRQSAVHN